MDKIIETLENNSVKKAGILLEKYPVKDLKDTKEFLDDMYHNKGESVVSDEKYDALVDFLKNKNNYVPKVGAALRTGDNRVNLPFWLGSADKITPERPDELRRWKEKNECSSYIISEKLDGVSCLFISKGGVVSLYTRGDGVVGADISYLSGVFKNMPKKLSRDIAVRGELIIEKEIFEKKYRSAEVNGRVYKNPRNMVSGLVSGKTAREGLRDISFIPYEIIGDETMDAPEDQMKTLKKLGFSPVKNKIEKKITVDSLSKILLEWKKESLYEIDGIIVQSNVKYDRNIDGNPSYLFAWKMLTEENIKMTTVLGVEWSPSKWGVLKPVVLFEPVEISGATLQKASGFNAKYIVENMIGEDAVINITRSQDVIPHIVSVETEAEVPGLPEGVDYEWDETKVNIKLKESCQEQCIKLADSFFSKLGIKFVSEATIKKMFDNGLDSVLKIVKADVPRLLEVPGFHEKTAERIYSNIREGLQKAKITDVLGASGVFQNSIGVRRVNMIFRAIPDVLEIEDMEELEEKILAVDGFSHITTKQFMENLPIAKKFLKKITPFCKFTKEKKVKTNENFAGKKFVLSGFRDKELEAKIAERGGEVTSAVSGKTFAVIVSSKNAEKSGKVKKAEEKGVKILTKDEVFEMF